MTQFAFGSDEEFAGRLDLTDSTKERWDELEALLRKQRWDAVDYLRANGLTIALAEAIHAINYGCAIAFMHYRNSIIQSN